MIDLRKLCGSVLLLALGGSAAGVTSLAAQPLRESNGLTVLARQDDRLAPREALQPLAELPGGLMTGLQEAWTALATADGDWQAFIDTRNARIASAEGTGLPWIPGAGNRLRREDIAGLLGTRAEPDLASLEKLARRFMAAHPAFFGVADRELRLNIGRSGKVTDHHWLVDFDIVLQGLTLEGARVLFRVGHGNLIQLGSEFLPPTGAQMPPVKISRKNAYAAFSTYVGGINPLTDDLVDPGSLHLLPAARDDDRSPEGFIPGQGYGLLTVWQFIFRREGVAGTWRGRVDATTGEVLEFVDTDVDAQATGGVASDTATGTEILRPLPFTNVGAGFADTSGRYTYNGSPLTSTLSGQYARSTSTCGAISLSTDAAGNLPFGSAGGNNCSTPGVGGAGNTRSSRTAFYYVNRGKEMARGWLPGNAWLNAQLTANVNLTGQCNGFWNGSTLQLYNAVAGTCGASGEEPGFVLHEYGHGLDANDGTGLDGATSESYADVTAAVNLHNSCVGPGFRTGNCAAYGDPCTACSGLRDIDWARHVSGAPHTVAAAAVAVRAAARCTASPMSPPRRSGTSPTATCPLPAATRPGTSWSASGTCRAPRPPPPSPATGRSRPSPRTAAMPVRGGRPCAPWTMTTATWRTVPRIPAACSPPSTATASPAPPTPGRTSASPPARRRPPPPSPSHPATTRWGWG